MGYISRREYEVHGNCANFKNGICTLTGTKVDPNGPACPRFTPKSLKTKQDSLRPESIGSVRQFDYQRSRYPPITRNIRRNLRNGSRISRFDRGRKRGGVGFNSNMSHIQTEQVNSNIPEQEKQRLTKRLKELEKRLNYIKQRLGK